MIHRLCISLTVASLIIFCSEVSAQRVPLELDQSITLPTTSAIWDVMPHPDGYYLWVQAAALGTDGARIYWGRTGTAGIDSFDTDRGTPESVTGFWREPDNHPWIVYAGRSQDTAHNYLRLSEYDLQTIMPDQVSNVFMDTDSMWDAANGHGEVHWGAAYLRCVVPFQLPPLVSNRVFCGIAYHSSSSYHYMGGHNGGDDYSELFLMNDVFEQFGDSLAHTRGRAVAGSVATWALNGTTFALGTSGGSGYSYDGPYTGTESFSVFQVMPDTAQRLATAMYSRAYAGFGGDLTACTVDRVTSSIIGLSHLPLDPLIALSSSLPNQVAWTDSIGYDFWSASECVPGNSTEEFLCYSVSRRVFDVLDATDGHSYGVTDTLSIPADGAVRITGRYDSTSRRLAFRDGNQIKLYRFGEYLGADDHSFIPHPSSLILSSYPNPFNPTTTISFALPQAGDVQLDVFDITGRLVSARAARRFEAGAHSLIFDGRDLASGIYFARLKAGDFEKTAKLLLIR